MKACTKCKENKNLEEFSKNKNRKDGLDAWCKSCCKIKGDAHYKANKDKRALQSLLWYENNLERAKTTRKTYKETNKEKAKVYRKNRYENNKELELAKGRAYYHANKEKEKIRRNLRYESNKEKEKITNDAWVKNNSGKVAAKIRKYQASKLQRTPKWLTEEHLKQIESFYIFAKLWSLLTGIPHEVDHDLPLQGKNVSGLHVPWNLRVLTQEENRSKGDKIVS